jgi:hypothetical protein
MLLMPGLRGTLSERKDLLRGLFGDFARSKPLFVRFSLPLPESLKMQKAPYYRGFCWSEREDLNLRPLVSQTSALTGLRHAPMPFH